MKKSILKSHLLRIVQSIFFQAAVVAGVIIFFLPESFEKYELKLVEKIVTPGRLVEPKNAMTYAHDLDSDGEDEIITSIDIYNSLGYQYFDKDLKIHDQDNFLGDYIAQRGVYLFFSDIDNDSFSEVWGFTMKNDSLFLNAKEPFDNDEPYDRDLIFIDTISKEYHDKIDVIIANGQFVDLNQDGKKEFAFFLRSGYNLVPRTINIYYPFGDSVKTMSLEGINPSNDIDFFDIDNDERLEIFFSNYSSHNHPPGFRTKYPDSLVYFTAIEDDLSDFAFPPKAFLWKYSRLYVIPFKRNDKVILAVLLSSNSKDLNQPSIAFYSAKGIPKYFNAGKQTPNHAMRVASLRFEGSKHIAVLDHDARSFYLYDSVFRFIKKFVSPYRLNLAFNQTINNSKEIDLNNNGNDELYFPGNGVKDVLVISDYLDEVTVYPTEEHIQFLFPFKTSKNQTQLWAITDQNIYKLKYQANPLYYWQYAVYLAIFFGVVLFIQIIRKLNEQRLREKYKLLNQVERLKLKSIQNQLDPHFVLNTTNSIGSSILNEEPEKAYNSFVRFAGLMRQMMHTNDDIFVKLSQEMDFVTEYLHFQNVRFGEKLNYSIEFDSSIDAEILVPKMLIFIHVENAIKHGIIPLLSGGQLKLELENQQSHVEVTITDNGIGRKKAKALKTNGNGLGLNILSDSFNIINNHNALKVEQEIIDLKDSEGNASGTKVMIWIPKNLKKF